MSNIGCYWIKGELYGKRSAFADWFKILNVDEAMPRLMEKYFADRRL